MGAGEGVGFAGLGEGGELRDLSEGGGDGAVAALQQFCELGDLLFETGGAFIGCFGKGGQLLDLTGTSCGIGLGGLE